MIKGARGGFTLVEVMFAGAIAVLLTLSLMEGLIVSAKISHENAELLAADAFAWDTAWRWLNKKNEDFDRDRGVGDYSASGGAELTYEDCPAIYLGNSRPKCYVSIFSCDEASTNAPVRFGAKMAATRIDVNVEWGPAGDRKCLNRLCGRDGLSNYGQAISVYRSDVGREGE